MNWDAAQGSGLMWNVAGTQPTVNVPGLWLRPFIDLKADRQMAADYVHFYYLIKFLHIIFLLIFVGIFS